MPFPNWPGIIEESVSILRILLLAGTNFSVLVVRCIWQVIILVFFFCLLISYVFPIDYKYIKRNRTANKF